MKRSPELTAIRGVAALWVFVYHIPIYIGFTIPLNTPIISAGYLGVPIFFILSISLLLRSLDENSSLEHYFLRRLKRIWPMYFVSIVLIFLYYGHSLTWLLEQSSFTGVFLDNQAIGYVFWSLQIEEVAYLFFPLIHRMSNANKQTLGMLLYFASAVSFMVILRDGLTASLWWLPLSLSSYSLGVFVYLRKIPKMVFPLILLALFYWDVEQFEMASFIVAPAFAYLVQQADSFKFLKWKSLVWVGDNSYGLYLLHPFLLSSLGVFGIVFALPVAWAFEQCNKGLLSRLSRIRLKAAVEGRPVVSSPPLVRPSPRESSPRPQSSSSRS